MREGFPKAAAMEDWAPGLAEAQQPLAEFKKKAVKAENSTGSSRDKGRSLEEWEQEAAKAERK